MSVGYRQSEQVIVGWKCLGPLTAGWSRYGQLTAGWSRSGQLTAGWSWSVQLTAGWSKCGQLTVGWSPSDELTVGWSRSGQQTAGWERSNQPTGSKIILTEKDPFPTKKRAEQKSHAKLVIISSGCAIGCIASLYRIAIQWEWKFSHSPTFGLRPQVGKLLNLPFPLYNLYLLTKQTKQLIWLLLMKNLRNDFLGAACGSPYIIFI